MGRALAVGSNTSSALRGRGARRLYIHTTERWHSSRHSWHNSFETWPDEEIYYTLSMYHCLPITPLSQVSSWYHGNCVSKVRRLDVSKYNQMDNWLVLAGGAGVLAHNDHICVTPLSPRHQPMVISTLPHIALQSLDDTTNTNINRYNGDDTGNKVCVVKYNLAVSCLCCGIETGTVTIMTRYSYLNWDGLYLFLHLVLITVSIPLPG